jgi:hypothetical protein
VEEGLVVGMAFSGGDATSSGLDSLSGDWISKWVKMDTSSFIFIYLFIFIHGVVVVEPWNKASLQIGDRIPYRLISRAMVASFGSFLGPD